MERRSFAHALCPIARSLDVLGDWWTPLILRECLYGVSRFEDLARWLPVSRGVLTQRLEKLVAAEVLERRRYAERPERFEYVLTEHGYDAAQVLMALLAYGEARLFEPGQHPIELRDRRTGKRVRPALYDAETGAPLDVRALYAAPGPGFPADPELRAARFSEHATRSRAAESSDGADAASAVGRKPTPERGARRRP